MAHSFAATIEDKARVRFVAQPRRVADPIDDLALATVRRILIQAGELALARSYVPLSRRVPGDDRQ